MFPLFSEEEEGACRLEPCHLQTSCAQVHVRTLQRAGLTSSCEHQGCVQFTVCFVLTILQQSEVCLLVVVGGLINMDVTFRNHKTNAAQRTQSSSVTIITTLFSWSFRRALFPLNQTLHTALFYLTHPRSPTLVCLSMGSVGQHNGLAMPQRSFLTELTSYCTWWPQFTVLQGL